MITLTILFIIIYAWSIYKIRIDSGSWDNFNPFHSNIIAFMSFMLITSFIICSIIGLLIYLAYKDIII